MSRTCGLLVSGQARPRVEDVGIRRTGSSIGSDFRCFRWQNDQACETQKGPPPRGDDPFAETDHPPQVVPRMVDSDEAGLADRRESQAMTMSPGMESSVNRQSINRCRAESTV
jgi:hypothetical protein